MESQEKELNKKITEARKKEKTSNRVYMNLLLGGSIESVIKILNESTQEEKKQIIEGVLKMFYNRIAKPTDKTKEIIQGLESLLKKVSLFEEMGNPLNIKKSVAVNNQVKGQNLGAASNVKRT